VAVFGSWEGSSIAVFHDTDSSKAKLMSPEDNNATPHDVHFGAMHTGDHLLVHVPIGDVESLSFGSDTITVVELNMMDKRMYFPLTALSGLTIRSILYPFTLVKTRLQLQRGCSVYTSLYDAFKKIVTNEGSRGLYRGFWISNLMIFSQVSYIGTYEFVRTYLAQQTPLTEQRLRSLIAGGCASVVGQTMIVPIDVVSQHLQLLGLGVQQSKKGRVSQNIVIPSLVGKSRFYAAQAIISSLYQQEGLRGFYKGYAASLMTYAPGSAMWWLFYDIYCGKYNNILYMQYGSDVDNTAINSSIFSLIQMP